jgi:hypothetical protein
VLHVSSYHKMHEHKHSQDSACFRYHCAQHSKRQHEAKKSENHDKHQDKEAMSSFRCEGWLSISLSDSDNVAIVKINHRDAHVPYWSIDIPSDVKDFIYENPELMPKQVRATVKVQLGVILYLYTWIDE